MLFFGCARFGPACSGVEYNYMHYGSLDAFWSCLPPPPSIPCRSIIELCVYDACSIGWLHARTGYCPRTAWTSWSHVFIGEFVKSRGLKWPKYLSNTILLHDSALEMESMRFGLHSLASWGFEDSCIWVHSTQLASMLRVNGWHKKIYVMSTSHMAIKSI